MTEVVLHVTAAEVELRIRVLEFAEDVARALAHDVREHVQAPAVGHAEHQLVDLMRVASAIDQERQQRDQALRAFEREALRADELLLDELLEDGARPSVRGMRTCSSRVSECVLGAFPSDLAASFHRQVASA